MTSQRDILPMRGAFPKPPKHLNPVGKKAWALGSPLWSDGTLQERDLLNWTLFCEAIQEKDQCETVLKEHGEYRLSHNCYTQHPAVKRRHDVERTIRKYSQHFGLLPSARKKRPAVSQGVAQRPKA